MRKIFFTMLLALTATCFTFARTFDGTEKIYFNAHGNGETWWTDGQAVQRAVLDNSTPIIGVADEGFTYSFIIPAGDYSTIRFERAETAEAGAWNATGDIAIPAEGNYVSAFAQNSTEATWSTLGRRTIYLNASNWDPTPVYLDVHVWNDGNIYVADYALTLMGGKTYKVDIRTDATNAEFHRKNPNDHGNIYNSHQALIPNEDNMLTIQDFSGNGSWSAFSEQKQTYHIYVDNQTSWNAFLLYAYGEYEAFGPFAEPTGQDATTTIKGKEYRDYSYEAYADVPGFALNLIFHQDGGEDNRANYTLDATEDVYLKVTDSGVTVFDPDDSATALDHLNSQSQGQKLIKDGQLLIIRPDGAIINVQGQQVH